MRFDLILKDGRGVNSSKTSVAHSPHDIDGYGFFCTDCQRGWTGTQLMRLMLIIEEPSTQIEWRMPLPDFLQRFPANYLKKVTESYYTAECTLLGSLRCTLGFHFDQFPQQAVAPLLYEIEFFRAKAATLEVSFAEFQRYFEATYGVAKTSGHSEGFPCYRWILPNAEIRHLVQDHFGLEEHLVINC